MSEKENEKKANQPKHALHVCSTPTRRALLTNMCLQTNEKENKNI